MQRNFPLSDVVMEKKFIVRLFVITLFLISLEKLHEAHKTTGNLNSRILPSAFTLEHHEKKSISTSKVDLKVQCFLNIFEREKAK
jgi:hypothetical protein